MRRLVWWGMALGLALVFGCTGTVEDTGPMTQVVAGDPMNCATGQRACGGACIDVLANPSSCGACGKACSSDQVCDQGACKAKAQGCSSGLLACTGACVDTQSNASHCGGCDRACGADRACSAGTCVCQANRNPCGTSCVDLQTDSANCGACGTACSGGRSCLQGSCQCATGRAFCGDTCVDAQTDAMNCGGCGVACMGGQVCAGGQCACPTGQTVCGSACVDTQASDANCGSCGTQCSLGQVCAAGQCGGGGGLREDGCMGLAQNITLSQIAVYQTVEVPVMKNGMEVAATARNTDVVIGRDAMFRVFVSVGAGFSARSMSARVFVQNGSAIDNYYAKKMVSASSQAATLDSTFQVSVPKDKITRDTRYAVEVVECDGNGSGGAQSPRFPATDGAALAARETGVLKIRLVPIQVNSMVADTSDTALASYRALMLAMYPITNIEFSVASTLMETDDQDWNGMLDAVRAKRQADAPTADVYYYGVLKPTATLREYCGSGCTAGIGFVPQGSANQQASQRAALGLAFGDAASAETMAHEVGHNHSRNHAPCVQGGSISGVDGSYPTSNGAIGVYGWDSRTQKLLAPDRTDVMGYCNNKWISDYTYDGLVNRVAQVNGATNELIAEGSLRPWRVLLLDSRGARWGVPIDEPSLPAGEPEPAEVLDASGQVIDTVDVYRTQVSDIDAFSIQVPAPEAGWKAIRVSGGGGGVAFRP